MADEKQLTVAELMARNAKNRPEGATSSRRRRRSLEEGGVSVAELTGNLEKVKATPAEAKHSSVSIDETAPVIPAPKKEEDKQAEAKQPAAAQGAAVRVEKPKADSKADTKADAEEKRHQPSAEDTHVIQRVKDEPEKEAEGSKAPAVAPAVPAEPAEPTQNAELEEYDDEEDYEEEEKLNPFAVVLLALVGVVLGAVVFKGFEVLWENFSRVVVLILAVVVTGVIVGIVHALRTNRDGLSMFLAAIAGLVLTFGPLLVVM
ncbi:hypothetical protein [Corynebacterium sp.]|uniref:hypothetical protein n=1 Tax=Corynebacterium sp. TaxID=1720 RepID=UPI0027BA8FA3|nr:hypothetical protein [Corynebacterium sp.]